MRTLIALENVVARVSTSQETFEIFDVVIGIFKKQRKITNLINRKKKWPGTGAVRLSFYKIQNSFKLCDFIKVTV